MENNEPSRFTDAQGREWWVSWVSGQANVCLDDTLVCYVLRGGSICLFEGYRGVIPGIVLRIAMRMVGDA